MTGVPIGMPVQAADKHHIGEAWKLYRQLIAADPTREVALLYNHHLDQWAVVPGWAWVGPHAGRDTPAGVERGRHDTSPSQPSGRL